jgi:aminobenzoyl-glutamate utilization protein B
MVNAAKVMAGVAVDALSDAALIARAKADLKARTDVTPYDCPIRRRSSRRCSRGPS